ncbi:MAG TPA: hypothetical protein VFJ20_05610, partial [Gemmatimonadaceae bacterium]|nr:hypothetical protein [Gemmatimonadaceae bacterium]
IQNTGSGDQTLDTMSYTVGLEPPPTPTITSVTLGTSNVILDGPATSYTITLNNQNINSFSSMILQLSIVEGTTTVGVGGGNVDCGAGTGVIPTGTCTITGTFTASSNGTGLVTGAATFQVKLTQFLFPSITTFDTKSVPITIAPNALSITSLQLESTTITIGSQVNYTVTVYNPTNTNLSTVLVQGEMIQGSTDRGAGGTNVVCGAGSGVLPPGSCTFQFIALASNTAGGTGTLVPGDATFRLTLYVYDGTTTTAYDVKNVAVTLVSP